jgi:hypothetical protein
LRNQLIKEIGLPVEEQQFLTEFTGWPRRLFPGALELVRRVSSSYVVGAFISDCKALSSSKCPYSILGVSVRGRGYSIGINESVIFD